MIYLLKLNVICLASVFSMYAHSHRTCSREKEGGNEEMNENEIKTKGRPRIIRFENKPASRLSNRSIFEIGFHPHEKCLGSTVHSI